MKEIRFNRKILLISGSILLFGILAFAVYYIGRNVKNIVYTMNHSIVVEMSENRYNEIAFEFERTNLVSEIISDLLAEEEDLDSLFLSTLTSTVFKLDPKIDEVWFGNKNKSPLIFYKNNNSNNIELCNDALIKSTLPNGLHKKDSLLYYRFCQSVDSTTKLDKPYFGYNIIMQNLHSYMVSNWKIMASYVIMTDANGIILLHPDSLLLGSLIPDSKMRNAIREAGDSNKRESLRSFSEYLQVPVETGYFPILINNQPMVIIVNIPYLVVEEELKRFQNYMLTMSLIAVLIFAIILIVLQQIWRKEHSLRLKVEQETTELKLQQILNQIDPHFLFNSLNSLYALIGRNTSQARQFVLSLSKVYRNILKKGKEPFSTLKNEINITEEYYFLQKIRFNGQLELDININTNLNKYLLPTMSIQTIVENAIKHNSISPENPLFIKIYTRKESLIIENNYTPKPSSSTESFGIGMKLISSMYAINTKSKIIITQENGIYRCQLPLIKPS